MKGKKSCLLFKRYRTGILLYQKTIFLIVMMQEQQQLK